jgi:beta-lactamase regulating signal transducer with metallopeptidase domain
LWSLALAATGFAPVAILAVMLVRGFLAGGAHEALPMRHVAVRAAAPAGAQWAGVPAQSSAVTSPAGGLALRVPAPPSVTPIVAGGIVAVWALGALIGLLGLGRSLARVHSLKGRSSPLDGALATELPWLTTTAGREIYLRLSYETETPIAIGFRRPVILLPTEMATADGLTSIEPLIMHEYAHLARFDDWTNLAQRATERIFWFNPLVWILGRRIALEREVAADEAVVARTHDAKRYASTLWRMAQEMRMPEHVVVAPGAMLTRKQISVRIERLLDENPAGRRYAGAAAFALTVVAATGVAGLAASAPPIVLAQNDAVDAVKPSVEPSPAVRIVKVVHVAPPALPTPRAVAVAPEPPASPEPDDMAQMGKQIAAEVQRNAAQVAENATRHNPIVSGAGDGPLSRGLVAQCAGCDFTGRDLHGMNLSNVSLVGDDFTRATLNGVNFTGARLQGLDFSHADLHDANLHGAKLTGVDLSHANLDNADLSDATLTAVDLGHASMNGTNTTGIRLIGSSLP